MSDKNNERVLCIPTRILAEYGWTRPGVTRADAGDVIYTLRHIREYRRRGDLEIDPTYRQLIPYMIPVFEGQYFTYYRKSNTTEVRLRGLRSLGIGGHVRQEDGASLYLCGEREWNEETDQPLRRWTLEQSFRGLINSDDDVGSVHTGILIFCHGGDMDLSLRDGEANEAAEWLTLEQLQARRGEFEGWSQHVIDWLALQGVTP